MDSPPRAASPTCASSLLSIIQLPHEITSINKEGKRQLELEKLCNFTQNLIIKSMIKEYHIFDIKGGYDDVHGDVLIVRAGVITNNMVSELPSQWDVFFFKHSEALANRLVSIAHTGRWNVDFSDFRESLILLEGKSQKVFYHSTLPKKEKKQGFWAKLMVK